jgi:class 3 adenylate cyclase
LALGETPNMAARLQALAEPNTVVISAATSQLVQGLFECRDLGSYTVKGVSSPVPPSSATPTTRRAWRWEAQLQEPEQPHRAIQRDVYGFSC